MSSSKRKFKKVTNAIIASNTLSSYRLVNIFNRLKYSKNLEKMNILKDEKDKLSIELDKYIYKNRQLEEYIDKIRNELHEIEQNIDTLRVNDEQLFKSNFTCDNLSKRTKSYRNKFGKVITNFSKFTIIDKAGFKLLRENDIIGVFNKYIPDNTCWYYAQVIENKRNYLIVDIGSGRNVYIYPYKWVEEYPASLLLYQK